MSIKIQVECVGSFLEKYKEDPDVTDDQLVYHLNNIVPNRVLKEHGGDCFIRDIIDFARSKGKEWGRSFSPNNLELPCKNSEYDTLKVTLDDNKKMSNLQCPKCGGNAYWKLPFCPWCHNQIPEMNSILTSGIIEAGINADRIPLVANANPEKIIVDDGDVKVTELDLAMAKNHC